MVILTETILLCYLSAQNGDINQFSIYLDYKDCGEQELFFYHWNIELQAQKDLILAFGTLKLDLFPPFPKRSLSTSKSLSSDHRKYSGFARTAGSPKYFVTVHVRRKTLISLLPLNIKISSLSADSGKLKI